MKFSWKFHGYPPNVNAIINLSIETIIQLLTIMGNSNLDDNI